MKFIFEWLVIIDRLATQTSTSRIAFRIGTRLINSSGHYQNQITSLYNEILHHTMEDRIIEIAFHGQLNEISACFRCLLCPQFNIDITDTGLHAYLAAGSRLINIDRTHL